MTMDHVAQNGLVLLGCGKMGSAMLAGWLADGLPASSVWVLDPAPSDWLQSTGVQINAPLPAAPAVAIIAVKPQMMGEALPAMAALGGGKTVFVSIAAGTPIAQFEAAFGASAPIVRSMPNTPAAIGQGITALFGNSAVTSGQMDMAEMLLAAVGETVRLESEAQIDAVTAVSGSGPAYVFHLIETMAAAGESQGLSAEMSLKLARATVAGAGALAMADDTSPAQLRINVTSPGGTTQAALEVLMDERSGFPALLDRAVTAAADRARELGNG